MSISHRTSYDFSSYLNPTTYSPEVQEEESRSRNSADRRSYKVAIVLLVLTLLFNAGAFVGLHFGFQYVEQGYIGERMPKGTAPAAPGQQFNPGLNMNSYILHLPRSTDKNTDGRIRGWQNVTFNNEIELTSNDTFRVKVDDSSPVTVYYQIYSHLAFKSPEGSHGYYFEQKLYRENKVAKTQREVLLTDQRTIICPGGNSTCYNSVIFSTLRLRKFDELYIETNYRNLLDGNPVKTFLSIFRLK